MKAFEVDRAGREGFTAAMQSAFATLLIGLWLVSGCAAARDQSAASGPSAAAGASASGGATKPDPAAPKNESESRLIVTPANGLVGTVFTYNTAGRFVVLDFPVGKMPVPEQVLFVYRQGLKVGEVRIAGPARDHLTVADLIAGEAQKGDQVRDR